MDVALEALGLGLRLDVKLVVYEADTGFKAVEPPFNEPDERLTQSKLLQPKGNEVLKEDTDEGWLIGDTVVLV